MKQLLNDIIGFTKNLSQIDYLLYFAILVLIILVVSLIYIIKTEDEEETSTSIEIENEDINLNEIVSNIENTTPPTIEFTSYEKEQEDKAIISYDELVARSNSGAINYDEEEIINNEISVKKIDLENIIASNESKKEIIKEENKSFRYINEETFLDTLKTLSETLN